MDAVLLDTQTKRQQLVMGDYQISISHDYTLGWSPEASKPGWPMAGGLIIREANGDFIIAGTGIVLSFEVPNNKNLSAGILQAEEGKFVNETWIPGRRMNGDQDHQGRHIRIPVGEWGIQRVRLYQYK